MEKNKKIIKLCYLQIAFYVVFLTSLLLHFKRGLDHRAFALLIILTLLGCASALTLTDYLKSLIRRSGFDVAGVHDKKSLEEKLLKLQNADDTLDVGVMMFDMNNLKMINDTYGHEEGDVFIQTFASYLTRILTEDSFLARFGGDEFVIVQNHATWNQLEQMNLQLQTMIDTYNQTTDHPLSYAVGYELSCKNHYYLIMDLLQMADEKMYQNKRYKKQLQKNGPLAARRSMLAESVSTDSLKEKIFTLLNNRSEEKQYAFLMTDVDNFHLINDYWGYEMGTNILNFILKKLELFPQTLFVNRYHSDIFVGIIDITGQDPAVVREKISAYHKQAIREVLESYPLNYMTLNTGVYYLNDTDTPTEEVISHANIARRRAKETSTCVFEYNAELSSTEQKRAETIHSFQNALAKKEFQIYFQPKISGKTQEIASAEVLVRWLREDGTLWFPDSFLPILEETGEIESLDYYVYNAAFQWLADRRENGLPLLPLSLNVSPVHFRKIDTFTQRITQLLDHYQIPSKYLVFEITETTYIHNIDAVNQMIRFFHDRNIRISMDDFGSGYSSLNSLKDILFDEVKIDKHFLSAGLSEKGKIVLEEMFHLLKRTDKWIVCEGVETKEMVDFLIAEGCDELQGFYYYKPMEQKKFEELIA